MADLNEIHRICDVGVGDLGDVDESVVLESNIDECTEGNNIANGSCNTVSLLEGLELDLLAYFGMTGMLARIFTGFLVRTLDEFDR